MSQKGRNDLTSVISSNIFDNINKEILASMIRTVLNDFRDSFFNLTDDQLKTVKYNDTQNLEQYLNSVIGAIPLWGSTDYFDPSSPTGSIESYNDNGIISSNTYINTSNERSELTINFSQSTSNRKLIATIHTEQPNVSAESNYTIPVIKRISSTQIKIGIREIGGFTGKVRIEILAF